MSEDIDVAQLRFLAALSANRINGLFFAGDSGQRIFQQAFSWKSLGVDIRGRSRTLHINYRTSHQVRMQADHLLDEAAIAAEKPRHYKSVKPKTISKKNLKISPKIT